MPLTAGGFIDINRADPEYTPERDDAWVASSCKLCYGACSILVLPLMGS